MIGSLTTSLLPAHSCKAPAVSWMSNLITDRMALPILLRTFSPILIGRTPGHLSRATRRLAVSGAVPWGSTCGTKLPCNGCCTAARICWSFHKGGAQTSSIDGIHPRGISTAFTIECSRANGDQGVKNYGVYGGNRRIVRNESWNESWLTVGVFLLKVLMYSSCMQLIIWRQVSIKWKSSSFSVFREKMWGSSNFALHHQLSKLAVCCSISCVIFVHHTSDDSVWSYLHMQDHWCHPSARSPTYAESKLRALLTWTLHVVSEGGVLAWPWRCESNRFQCRTFSTCTKMSGEFSRKLLASLSWWNEKKLVIPLCMQQWWLGWNHHHSLCHSTWRRHEISPCKEASM